LAGADVSTGNQNVVIGGEAGFTDTPLTTGSRAVFIGAGAGLKTQQATYVVAVGYLAKADNNNTVALGPSTLAGGAGSVAIGTDSGGAGATTAVANEIKLGTANHTVNIPGSALIAGSLDVDGISASPITSGTLPTVTPSSGMAFQCLTTRDVTLVIATTATLLSGTATIDLSPDNTTFSTLGIATPGVAASVDLDTISVPAGWWVKITLSSATVTCTYY
jgi:hypothetical protein